MTNAFKSIKQGLTEAIAHAKTKGTTTTGVKLNHPIGRGTSQQNAAGSLLRASH
jgi:hypothetical protein